MTSPIRGYALSRTDALPIVNRYANAEFKFKRDAALFSRGKRLVVNYLVQGGSRDLLVLAMNRFRTLAPEGFTLVTTVHDEILTQHPIGRGDEAREIGRASCRERGESAVGAGAVYKERERLPLRPLP